jgi:fucose permease
MKKSNLLLIRVKTAVYTLNNNYFTMKQKNFYLALLPAMLSFFAMGFVDMVGIATNYAKADLNLSDTVSNLFPSMVFFWFLILSVPTGILMNRIGQRKTVILSLVVTSLSLVVPFVDYSFGSMLVSFSLLGIGNTLMQVSVNPLLSNIVRGNRLASSLTLGQFVKAIASFLAPIIAAWAARGLGDWKYLFLIFLAVSVIATLWLGLTPIEEEGEKQKGSSIADSFRLLGDGTILLLFVGIMCHVGIDVGVNVTAPRILIERVGLTLGDTGGGVRSFFDDAGFATSWYFLFRTIGCFLGAFILARFPAKRFFVVSVVAMTLSIVCFFVFDGIVGIYTAIALMGFGNSNIFPIILSRAMLYMPGKKNEVSGLMIMGLFGGTVFPFFMGLATDAMSSQTGALIVLAVCIAYLLFSATRLRESY